MPTTPAVPAELLARLRELFPADYDSIVASYSTPRPTTFRVNTLKAALEPTIEALRAQGFVIHRIPWLPNAFHLVSPGIRQLTETDIYKNGSIYVQSLASMIPPLVLAPQPGDAVLDLTAAPGSKTTQMAALMQNEGQIVANDASRVRLYKLQANLALQGATHVHVEHGMGQRLWQRFSSVFDRVLVDAPCSMEGRMFLGKPSSVQNWSLRAIRELANRQRGLVRSGFRALKPGGTLVYSTCTLSPEENEGVVSWLRKKEPAAHIVPIGLDLPIPEVRPGMRQWRDTHYDPEVTNCVRILPSAQTEGFFVCKIHKA